MKCTVCGNELAKVTKFCPQCGTKVKFFCTKCNTELSEGVEYCPSCGCPVTEDKTQTEKNTSDIILKSIGENKVKIIKIVREATGWDLKRTKEEIDNLQAGNNLLIRDIPQEKVEEAVKGLRQNGVAVEVFGCDFDVDIRVNAASEDIQDKGKIKRERTKIGFKGSLLIAFISFFLPFCTVSCGSEKIMSPSGYELAGDWGMTKDAMEEYGITLEDTINNSVVLTLVIMAIAILLLSEIEKTIGMIISAGLATFFLWTLRSDEIWDNIRNIGCEVTFQFGYWLALVMLFLATMAFLWSPMVIKKIEEMLVKNKGNHVHGEQLRENIDGVLSAIIVMVIIVAVVTNWSSIKSWGKVFGHKETSGLEERYINMDELEDSIEDSYDIEETVDNLISSLNPTFGENEVRIEATEETTAYVDDSFNNIPTYYEEPEEEMYGGLTKESVGNTAYSSNTTGILMEIGTYSETGTIYINFSFNSQLIWNGDLNRTQTLENGGICLMFEGMNYTTGENDYLDVEWSSAEAIDFPIVNYEFDNIGLSGSYSYSYMLEAN